MELLSVLMSVYNETPKQIKESVVSILKQTYSNFELIIVNDNPQEKVLNDFLQELKASDERITVLTNEKNIGLAMSMNKAAAISHGNILIRMDADDVSEQNRFITEYDSLIQNGYDLVFSNYTFIDEEGNELYNGQQGLNYVQKSNIVYDVFMSDIIHHPTVMMKKEIFNKAGQYRDFPCAQDKDLWLRMISCGVQFGYINQSLLRYRLRENGVTLKNKLKQCLTTNYIILLFLERINKGKDSYSIENYNKYMEVNHYNNPTSIKQFNKAKDILQMAKNSRLLPQRIIKKICVLVSNKPLRENYILRNFKGKMVRQYIKSIYK